MGETAGGKMSETESRSIVWTKVMYRGYVLSVTSRDGGDVTPSFVEIAEFLEKYKDDIYPYVDGVNRHVFLDKPEFNEDEYLFPEAAAREAKEKGVVDIAKDMGGVENLGLIDYPPKAADRVPGQKFELLVDSYTLDSKRVQFWRADSEFPMHTHYLSDYGKKKMEELFTSQWEKYFPLADDPAPIFNGELVIGLEVGTSKNKQENYYVNLVSIRRP
jgi:hypothetical protein